MIISTEMPTLLVFTLGLKCERSRRRLLPGPLQLTESLLHHQGLDDMLEAGRKAGCRIVVSSPEPLELPPDVQQLRQHGRGFAARLRGAISTLQGDLLDGSPLLVVGTDAPDLGAGQLRSAIALLEESPGDVVLGPSHDGGFYLLATRLVLDDELAEVRWCRHDTLRRLEAALNRGGRAVRFLEPLRDLDRCADLETWLRARSPALSVAWLRSLLSRLLAEWRRPTVETTIGRPRATAATVAYGRGPPI